MTASTFQTDVPVTAVVPGARRNAPEVQRCVLQVSGNALVKPAMCFGWGQAFAVHHGNQPVNTGDFKNGFAAGERVHGRKVAFAFAPEGLGNDDLLFELAAIFMSVAEMQVEVTQSIWPEEAVELPYKRIAANHRYGEGERRNKNNFQQSKAPQLNAYIRANCSSGVEGLAQQATCLLDSRRVEGMA